MVGGLVTAAKPPGIRKEFTGRIDKSSRPSNQSCLTAPAVSSGHPIKPAIPARAVPASPRACKLRTTAPSFYSSGATQAGRIDVEMDRI